MFTAFLLLLFPTTSKVAKHTQTIYHWKPENMEEIIIATRIVIFCFTIYYYYYQLIMKLVFTSSDEPFLSPAEGLEVGVLQ